MSIPNALLATVLAAAGSAAPAPAHADAGIVDAVVADACARRIVLLGELGTHGEARAHAAKAEAARRLVEECGFDTILFEAPMHEFSALEASGGDGGPSQAALDDAIGGFWRTAELAPWRAWLRGRVASGRLYIGGIDDQVAATSNLTEASMPAVVASTLADADGAACSDSVARHLAWGYDASHPFDAAEKARLYGCARRARDALAERDPSSPAAASLAAFAAYVGRQAGDADARTRSASMHALLEWHRLRRGTAPRVVVWTATPHAARGEGSGRGGQPLGSRLATAHGDALWSIGFSALGGRSLQAGVTARVLEPMPPDSLEARALADGRGAAYLAGEALHAVDGTPSRLFGPTRAAAWSREFDAVIVFREEVQPTFPAKPAP